MPGSAGGLVSRVLLAEFVDPLAGVAAVVAVVPVAGTVLAAAGRAAAGGSCRAQGETSNLHEGLACVSSELLQVFLGYEHAIVIAVRTKYALS